MLLDYRRNPILQQGNSYWPVEKDFSYIPAMESDNLDPVRKLIWEKAKARKGKLKGLSVEIGRNHAYLQQFVKRGIPRALEEADRHRLAQLLDVDQVDLGAPVGMQPLPDLASVPQNARMGGPRELLSTVPAYGQAAGGKDGQFVLNGNKIADILAPASLTGVRVVS